MKRASIDIGSNSILLLAASVDARGHIQEEHLNESSITSLGKDLDKTGVFHPTSMEASFSALKKYRDLLLSIHMKPEEAIVTATEASRVAQNASLFYERVKQELGFDVSIISPKAEAHYTAVGVMSSLTGSLDTVIMDIGGASTELIHVTPEPFSINRSISLPVGSVRAMDWRRGESFFEKMNPIMNQDFSSYETKSLVCVAGSMTALAAMYLGLKEFDAGKIEGMEIKLSSFQNFREDLNKTSLENLMMLFPFLGKRAPMVSSGALVAELIAKKLGVEVMRISTRGLRYGTIITGAIDEKLS